MSKFVSTDEGTAIMAAMEDDRKNAEKYLLHYHELLADYKAAKQEYLEGMPKQASYGRSNIPGKPTEGKAIKSVSYDEEHSDEFNWLKAVEICERTLADRKLIFLKVRRDAENHNSNTHGRGRRGWVVYAQKHFTEEVQRRFLQPEAYLSERTAHAWWDNMISFTVEAHLRLKKY